MERRREIEYIKLIELKKIANIAVYHYGSYVLEIEKTLDDPIIITGYHIDDKEGLHYPTFTILNDMIINSHSMRIDLNKINDLIEALEDLKDIKENIPQLIKLANFIPEVYE